MTAQTNVQVKILRDPESDPKIALPSYETLGAAGADLRANLPFDDRVEGWVLRPMERRIVPTGLRVEIPEGYEMQIRPRSGLAAKFGVTLVNAPGTIDSDYRGALGVILINLGTDSFVISHGERIAQAVIAPVFQANYLLVDALSDTKRGALGFGSTGQK